MSFTVYFEHMVQKRSYLAGKKNSIGISYPTWNDPASELSHKSWLLQHNKPFIGDGKVIMLLATGPELEFIREKFSNIPMYSDVGITWREPYAQFIFDNLP